MKRSSPERKEMMGHRQLNSDGFTYPYGRFPFNFNTRSESIKRQIRYDKRAVRQAETRRLEKEEE